MGISGEVGITLEYCRELLLEYTALDSAQLYSLLKRYSDFSRKKRLRFCKALCTAQYARWVEIGDRRYFTVRPGVRIEGRLRQQISCFWVLLDYFDRVERHFATGTPGSLISMEIGGRDYSILYAERGKERACCYSMEQGGETRYFVMIEDLSQIPLIKGNRIHAFAILDEKNTIQYYSGSYTGGTEHAKRNWDDTQRSDAVGAELARGADWQPSCADGPGA